MKKETALFLLVLMLLAVFSGCENVVYPGEAESSAAVGENSQDITDLLPEISDSGDGNIEIYNCRVATDKPAHFDSSESDATLVNSALEQRGKVLLERYRINQEVIAVDRANLAAEIKAALLSGTDTYDLLFYSQADAVKLYLDGLLYDLNSLPGFDAESPLFDKANATALATGKTLYMLPDASNYYFDELYAVFFNRDMVGESGGDPETLVQKGEWTWDKFSELAKSASNVANGVYGFSVYYENYDFSYPMWMSAGRHIIEGTYNGKIALSMPASEIESVTEELVKHYNVSYVYPKTGSDASAAFMNGNTAFIFHKLNYLYALRDGSEKGSEYGFLPMPKLSEEQKSYSCLASSEAHVLAIPATARFKNQSESMRTYALLATTCGIGSETMKTAYIRTQLVSYLMTNAETVMLSEIVGSATFDFARTFGGEISEIAGPTVRAVGDRIGYGSKVQSSINRSIAAFNKYVAEHFDQDT